MKKMLIIFLLTILFSCKKEIVADSKISEYNSIAQIEPTSAQNSVIINTEKNTIRERFNAPEGYQWIDSQRKTYGDFIENFQLKNYGTPILKFNGEKIANQNLHEAVFDISVGDKDLQQCADAIIRLRAEYLKYSGLEDEIAFHYTSGHLLKWSDYKNGHRLIVEGNKVTEAIISAAGPETNSFQNYLKNIFTYAGTISQFRETSPVTNNSDLKTGDILITAGSPGHVVFIAGVSKNAEGKKRYLLAEGFTPAQSISVMKNPHNPKISPWYELDVNAPEISTSRYSFKPVSFRRY